MAQGEPAYRAQNLTRNSPNLHYHHQADASKTDLSFSSASPFPSFSAVFSAFILFLPSTPTATLHRSCLGSSTFCVYQSRLKTLSNLASTFGFSKPVSINERSLSLILLRHLFSSFYLFIRCVLASVGPSVDRLVGPLLKLSKIEEIQ